MFRVGKRMGATSRRRGAIALACGLTAVALSGCWWDNTKTLTSSDPTDCPAPQQLSAAQISDLRASGFAGDLAAQYALAQGYDGRDPAEAAVWYTVALANPGSYSQGAQDDADARPDCQTLRRKTAGQSLWRLVGGQSSAETEQVRDRAEYILAASGPAGYRTLSRLYSRKFGIFGEPYDNSPILENSKAPLPPPAGPVGPDIFGDNDIDSQVFVWLAQHGDGKRAPANDAIAQRAVLWRPVYEFYPPASPGLPLSDESGYIARGDAAAIARIDRQPFAVIGAALQSIGITRDVVRDERWLPPGAASRFQAMLGEPQTGQLSALDKVRAIQAAAVRGDANAQVVLGVMYAEGVGVRPNIVRARAWLQAAERQHHPKARLALDRLRSLGR
jgi:hypothetical protein